MEIVFVDELGYCPGVEHALRVANTELDEPEHGPVFALGALIHNGQEMGRLFGKGLTVINSFRDVESGTVVVRAHGIPYHEFDEARERGLTVKDGTCSIVTRAQRAARRLRQDGRRVLIYGDPTHPEVIGVVGAVDGEATVLPGPEAAQALDLQPGDRVGLICQTTKQPQRFQQVAEAITAKEGVDVRVTDTICPYVIGRQAGTRRVAGEVDVMIVVGGHHSSNTRHLASLSESAGTRAYQVETPDELCPEWFAGVERVGVTSGLSTPMWIVDQVCDRIRELAA
ncbi:MAG TPA: 4-hydroxy-3-methylbut-2-enyl diphosphate reductase [Armatimonadota bacterium]|jgi:4-hydroxy-3-methylbut-2-enyl diphosphate reductase